ncbi:MAG: hypothetical protein LBH18_06750 [Spirochaetaceae bacterium]|nr:hypothetical protein [Spirochaetaceae bacterium]
MALECYNDSITGKRFERWVEFNLLNKARTVCAIIMDGVSFHIKKLFEKICVKAKVNLLFFPVYSPDFIPIGKD